MPFGPKDHSLEVLSPPRPSSAGTWTLWGIYTVDDDDDDDRIIGDSGRSTSLVLAGFLVSPRGFGHLVGAPCRLGFTNEGSKGSIWLSRKENPEKTGKTNVFCSKVLGHVYLYNKHILGEAESLGRT